LVIDVVTPVVADTHTIIWYLQADPRLTDAARDSLRSAVADGLPIFVSAVTAVELQYLLDKHKITHNEYHWYLALFESAAEAIEVAPVDLGIARAVESPPREVVPDPFDRMIAATAMALGVPLVTCDRKLLKLDAVETVW
jgi:PIN domain nuclease of toxin-antitoxin system